MIYIISCGSKMKPGLHRACDLYEGSLFKSNLRWVRSVCDDLERVFILSAKHGLVRANKRLTCYNLKMGDPGSVTVDTLKAQIRELGFLQSTPVVVLAGASYLGMLRKVFSNITCPVDGMSMGYMMQWAKQNKGKKIYDNDTVHEDS